MLLRKQLAFYIDRNPIDFQGNHAREKANSRSFSYREKGFY